MTSCVPSRGIPAPVSSALALRARRCCASDTRPEPVEALLRVENLLLTPGLGRNLTLVSYSNGSLFKSVLDVDPNHRDDEKLIVSTTEKETLAVHDVLGREGHSATKPWLVPWHDKAHLAS